MRLTASQALERIQGSGMTRKAKGMPMRLLRSVKSSRRDRLFVFGRGDSAIVAPADDALQPVVAEFDMESGVINPAAQLMLDDYARAVAMVQSGGARVPTAEPGVYVAPMLGDIAWHQHEPFNDGLEFVEVKPTKGLVEKCIVGCPATAVSMLMYFFSKKGWLRGCTATSAYVSKAIDGYQFNVTPSTARMEFDYKNMLDVYTKRKGAKYVPVVTYTSEQAKAVADLCSQVGKAMQMYYSPTGSGQWPDPVVKAIEQHLHLGKVTAYSQSSKTDQDTTHLDKVRASLANGMPVLICGYTSTAKTASGHWFIADGYRQDDDTYHINWGWGIGFNNGWFKMSLLSYLKKETSFNFSYKKTFLILDKPSWNMDVNRDGYINMSDVTQVIDTSISGKYDPMADVNYDGKVDMKDAQAITDKILGK